MGKFKEFWNGQKHCKDQRQTQYSEKRYFISSIEDINEFVIAVRTHLTVENTLHWPLDVIFRDDECQSLRKNTAENIAI